MYYFYPDSHYSSRPSVFLLYAEESFAVRRGGICAILVYFFIFLLYRATGRCCLFEIRMQAARRGAMFVCSGSDRLGKGGEALVLYDTRFP